MIGTLAAYGVERTDLPGRHVWAVLVVVPFAIPDFVVSFGWSSLSTWVAGFRGAVLVMTLAVYPLVYLPVAASLRGADPGQEEIARSLGASRLSTFFRITLGQARRAILGGCLLVALVILAEYGAFEILGYQTFTTEIFTEFTIGFDTASACALSLVLVVLSASSCSSARARCAGAAGSAAAARASSACSRAAASGARRLPVLVAFALLVVAALGVPVGSSVYWIFEGGAHRLSGVSLVLGGAATPPATAPSAALRGDADGAAGRAARRAPSRTSCTACSSAPPSSSSRCPGLVVALALSYFSEQHAERLRLPDARRCSIFAYALMFFPLALVGVRASVAQAPVAFEEVAGSLGVRAARACSCG